MAIFTFKNTRRPGAGDVYAQGIEALRAALADADAICVGAGAGLSTAAGFVYTGERYERLFPDYIARYHVNDMYSMGFYPFASPEELWAFWSRYIWCNRYEDAPKDTYQKLARLVAGTDHFAITTNVDHCFQKASWDKKRLFYTQGDYGLFQCSVPCHKATYDNYEQVKAMVEQQSDMRIPSELVPTCPVCGEPMTMNLRSDDTFVEDEGWHEAAGRYTAWLRAHDNCKVVYLELGVGGNTPGIIKYPFWRYVYDNPKATYVCVNYGETFVPREIEDRSIAIDADVDRVLEDLLG